MSKTEASWRVYIIESRSGKLYTGITTDVERRYKEHQQVANGGQKGAKFFRIDPPTQLVYSEACSNRSDASKREAQIKKYKRADKLALIRASKP